MTYIIVFSCTGTGMQPLILMTKVDGISPDQSIDEVMESEELRAQKKVPIICRYTYTYGLIQTGESGVSETGFNIIKYLPDVITPFVVSLNEESF